MITRRFLYLNSQRLSAYAWIRGELVQEDMFDSDDGGLARFEHYLRQHADSHFHLLANVGEESHVLETIPFLRGADRAALIARKLGQHFLGTPLNAALSLGYEKGKRKNEKLLLSALTNPDHFTPWLDRLNETAAPLAGLYSVAQLGGALLGKLSLDRSRCLLLSVQDHSIRESFIVNGHTLFSRMALITDSSIAGMAGALVAEAGKLQQYLIGQRLISRDETLPVYLLTHPLAIPAIRNACPDPGKLDFSIIDTHEAAQRLKLHRAPEDSRSETLFLQLLATQRPAQQFADPPRRHDFRISQLRQALIGAGLIALLGGLLFAAKELYSAHVLRNESQALSASEADLSWRYQEISATFSQLGLDNETLRRLTDRQRTLLRQQRQPGPLFHALSSALDDSPAITLETLTWKNAAPSSLPPGGLPPQSPPQEEVLLVQANVQTAAHATPRQILATVEQFAERLRHTASLSVQVVQPPFNMESSGPLRGGDADRQRDDAHTFTLQLSRRSAP